jgi:RNA polymerase sigma-70 factor (ECF subfamily)
LKASKNCTHTLKEERVLLGKAKQGNQLCFEELELASRPQVTASIRGCTRNDWFKAEDIYQRGTIKAWKKIKGFKGNSRFSTWLHRICYNLCCDDFRSAKRRGESSLEALVEQNVPITTSVDVSLDHSFLKEARNLGARNIEMKELGKRVKKVLRGLNEDHKEVLELSMVDGLSYEQISRKIGCPVGTVMSRIFYARRRAQDTYNRLLNRETTNAKILRGKKTTK